jgi:hypothetical protein
MVQVERVGHFRRVGQVKAAKAAKTASFFVSASLAVLPKM